MESITNQISDALGPAGTSTLGQALIGLAILVIGLFVVSLLAGIFGRLLAKVGFLNDANLTTPITSLVKAILTVFVLIAVLDHFGLTDVLVPLQNMLDQFVGALPNIIGAGVVGYVGWVLAKIVSELAAAALGKVDAQLAERTGSDEIKVSGFGSALVFAIVLLPITVAALGILAIPEISDPASAMINKLMDAVPNIIGAGIILLVTYLVVRFVNFILAGLLQGMQVDALPARVGVDNMFSDNFTLTKLICGVIMFFAMLSATTAAINTLGIEILSSIFARVLEFGGGILVGAVILVIGNFLSALAYNKLTESGSAGVAVVARIAILGLVLAMGLRAMGLADNIVNLAFGLALGAVAVSTAIAFGFGGRDAAKAVADDWASKITNKSDD